MRLYSSLPFDYLNGRDVPVGTVFMVVSATRYNYRDAFFYIEVLTEDYFGWLILPTRHIIQNVCLPFKP